MSALPILLISGVLHIAAFATLIRHMRAERCRVQRLPVIGSHPRLTETLHARLCHRQPQTDWLSIHSLRAKIAAWKRQQREGRP